MFDKMVSAIERRPDETQAVVKKDAIAVNPEVIAGENEKSEKKEDKPEEPEVPQGSITEAKSLFQKKDSDGKYQWVVDEPQDVVEAVPAAGKVPIGMIGQVDDRGFVRFRFVV